MISLPIMYVALLVKNLDFYRIYYCRLIIDFLRRGAFTSWVLIELIWLCEGSNR